ncbi:hypothetical protein SIID45300_00097 [Candidatus Magnetaquicoccaceae bacterium FCR-1]|uniref:Uncharacterized protein n=1 Tax=Candidatus Magnetaquiglobus chichijimensis TaxID=3141448 RepID=A0ABQ0C4J3_9PROT
MKQLGDVVLPDGLVWSDRHAAALVEQTVVRTLGGKPVIWARNQFAGRPVTLEARNDAAWLDRDTVEALAVLAALAGASYPLVWENWHGTVIFRHDTPPAFAVEPVWPHQDRFTGTIRLLTI